MALRFGIFRRDGGTRPQTRNAYSPAAIIEHTMPPIEVRGWSSSSLFLRKGFLGCALTQRTQKSSLPLRKPHRNLQPCPDPAAVAGSTRKAA
jgi:hypothetical protein